MGQDNKIRKKLNAREIQPSPQSWDRLDAMLSVKEEKKNKRGFGWLYIAASFLVFTGLGFWLYPDSTEIIIPENNNIVITNGNLPSESDKVKNANQDGVVKDKMNNVILVQQEEKIVNKIMPKEVVVKTDIVVAESLRKDNILVKKQQVNISSLNVSPEKLLASVEKTIQSDINVTVLNSKKSSVKVNPNSLLSSVEGEMDEEYRETTLDKLKRNFNHVKTAVAKRNYE